MTDLDWLEFVECRTASEFVDNLRPSHERWRGEALETEWLFRGHADANWELKPAAWRKDEDIPNWKILKDLIVKCDGFQRRLKSFLQHLDSPPIRFEGSQEKEWRALPDNVKRGRLHAALLQATFELQLIRDFRSIANEVGHPLGDLSWARSGFDAQLGTFFLRQEDDFQQLCVAAAQHHGVPTCMLDWTMNPLAAAFFAVSSDRLGEKIALWAMRREVIRQRSGLREFHVPRHQLPFLHAQSGCFVWHQEGDCHFSLTGEWPAQDELVRQQFPMRQWKTPYMVKIVLPCCEAPLVREHLWSEGFSRAHLMPTLENVSRSLLQTFSWRRDGSLLSWRGQ